MSPNPTKPTFDHSNVESGTPDLKEGEGAFSRVKEKSKPEKHTLIYVPDKRLSTVCDPVGEVTTEIADTLEEMAELLYVHDGVGLAAPQLGITKRFFVADPRHTDKSNVTKMINPEILWHSDTGDTRAEGCLSIPDIYVEMTRPESVKVKYMDERGEEQMLEASGLLAKIIQHENDHLDGVLLTDFLSPLKKKMALAKVKKYVRLHSS